MKFRIAGYLLFFVLVLVSGALETYYFSTHFVYSGAFGYTWGAFVTTRLRLLAAEWELRQILTYQHHKIHQ